MFHDDKASRNIVPLRPRVSVVMPMYNVARFVVEAIDSVRDQSFTDFELILVDDGSTDQTCQIAACYDDPRIRFIGQANRGLAGARNSGIAAARGDYVALLDSDDRWHKDKLALHVIHLDNDPSVGVSYSGSRFIDVEGRPLRMAQRPKLSNIRPQDIFCRNPVGNGSAPVFRRSALDLAAHDHPFEAGRRCWFDEALRQSEDIELWIRLSVAHQVRFEGIRPLLTDYRLQGGGLSASVVRQFDSWLAVAERVRAYAPEFSARYEARAKAYQLRYLARRAVQLGNPAMALELLSQSARSSVFPFVAEPIRSLVTLGAALAERQLGPDRFALFADRLAKGSLVA